MYPLTEYEFSIYSVYFFGLLAWWYFGDLPKAQKDGRMMGIGFGIMLFVILVCVIGTEIYIKFFYTSPLCELSYVEC